jgi:hypothetical protein
VAAARVRRNKMDSKDMDSNSSSMVKGLPGLTLELRPCAGSRSRQCQSASVTCPWHGIGTSYMRTRMFTRRFWYSVSI